MDLTKDESTHWKFSLMSSSSSLKAINRANYIGNNRISWWTLHMQLLHRAANLGTFNCPPRPSCHRLAGNYANKHLFSLVRSGKMSLTEKVILSWRFTTFSLFQYRPFQDSWDFLKWDFFLHHLLTFNLPRFARVSCFWNFYFEVL